MYFRDGGRDAGYLSLQRCDLPSSIEFGFLEYFGPADLPECRAALTVNDAVMSLSLYRA